jgi:hypothetical protein
MQAIFSDRLAKPVGFFSPAVRSDAPGHIFASGQIGQSADWSKAVLNVKRNRYLQIWPPFWKPLTVHFQTLCARRCI